MKTILVTGGAGFIGSNFVRHLLDRYPTYRVIVLDLLTYAGNTDNLPEGLFQNAHHEDTRLSFWYGNVGNASLVDSLVEQSDLIVHFAAESHVTRSIYDNRIFFETDVLGTQVLANSVLNHANRVEKFIHISTSEVYGTAEKESMDELHPLNPMSPYASAKAGADRLVYSYWATYDIPATIVRPFNNYGPYQHLEKLIPRFITSAILGEPMTVHGTGTASRDWIFVDDHCRALDTILHTQDDSLRGEVINLGSGRSTSVLEIARMVKRLTNANSEIIFVGDRPGQVVRHTCCSDKAKQLLDWEAETQFEDGLKKTIDWYEKNPKWWEKSLWLRQVPIRTATGKVEYH